MYYHTRRIPLEYLALVVAVVAVLAALLYTPHQAVLASGYSHLRVLMATESGNALHIVLWLPAAQTLAVAGDANADLGAVPPGVYEFSISGTSAKTVHICFVSAEFNDCGMLRPLRVS
ncbi:MAG: hypothetical protein GXN93_01490 [Candidatus Diapherotrites archaeon]|nr:hypothetical protein [Candidatus Diapherotrites archaeon]